MEYGFYNYPSTDYHILKNPQTANNNYTSKKKNEWLYTPILNF